MWSRGWAWILVVVVAACGQLDTSRSTGESNEAPRIAPYGSWASPIAAADLVAGAGRISELEVDGDALFWRERRPEEGGRAVVMRRDADGSIGRVTPDGFNVRTTVHEYGGGAFMVTDGVIVFSNYADQRLYRHRPGGDPDPLTPASDGRLRYADCVFDSGRERLICVREDHRGDGEASNTLVSIEGSGDPAGTVLFSGTDFVSTPRLSPDGSRLVFLAWDHPNMPWDSVGLWLAEFDRDGGLINPRRLNPGHEEAVMAPAWSPAGELYAITDRTDWWSLYRWNGTDLELVHGGDYEIGLPSWVFDRGLYDFTSDGRIVAAVNDRATEGLIVIDPATGLGQRMDLPIVSLRGGIV
jgi:dipeptidyl aminopeptidase/acylaminoacyl peptidase